MNFSNTVRDSDFFFFVPFFAFVIVFCHHNKEKHPAEIVAPHQLITSKKGLVYQLCTSLPLVN